MREWDKLKANATIEFNGIFLYKFITHILGYINTITFHWGRQGAFPYIKYISKLLHPMFF